MNKEDKAKLAKYVSEVATCLAKQKELADQIKDICETAKEAIGKDGKTIKQLAKEQNMDGIERMKRRLLEEELDECRHALGILVDLPLGQATVHRMKDLRAAE